MYRLWATISFLFLVSISLFANGTENAIEGFFIILQIVFIIVGLILLVSHFKTKHFKTITAFVLLAYSLSVFYFHISNYALVKDVEYYSFWENEFMFFIPVSISAAIAFTTAIVFFFQKK